MALTGNESTQSVMSIAGAFVQCFVYGVYTLLFAACLWVSCILKPTHRWLLRGTSIAVYLVSTVSLIYDLVMTCLDVKSGGAVRLYRLSMGGDAVFLKSRMSLFVVMSAFTESLVVWRLYRLWTKAEWGSSIAGGLNIAIVGCGLFLVHWKGPRTTLDFQYDLYRWISFAFATVLALLIAGRTYWMSNRLRVLYGSQVRPRTYTWLGAFIDGGALFVLFRLADLAAGNVHIIRPMLPQIAAITATLIVFQEVLGKASQDISVAARNIEDGRQSPILDTLFSTPGVSLQWTINQAGAIVDRGQRADGGSGGVSTAGSLSMVSTRSECHEYGGNCAGNDEDSRKEKSKSSMVEVAGEVDRDSPETLRSTVEGRPR
ncbi:hypothetical protein D9611_007826 [Ephemerocybe angulata]|uniref:Uncharacterized protein n=2 Tax=Ephemerocybe angulata TaxID=980116 RepID=A0A8H6HUH6_9AGAR|nr:hypothetical protein D9611_007826 [Tulosesus angulatus]KAF6752849.1 hypothetical protein DFP72DRAFT_442014 [Tulosesus angulatus]